MIEPVLLLKLIHVVSSAVLFCGVFSTALILTLARGSEALGAVAGLLHRAGIVTAVAMVVQPLTGIWLIVVLEDAAMQPWLVLAYVLYVAAAGLWSVALAATRRLAAAGGRDMTVYSRARLLSWLATGAVVVIYFLMLTQPALWGKAG